MKQFILCVDDEKIVLDSLRYPLSNEFSDAFDIEYAESGEEAIEIIEEMIEDGYNFPVIVSDQIMPGMKGDELLAEISKLSPETMQIMLTGQASAESVGNAVNNANLYRYISKPWDEQDLLMTIKEASKSFSQKKEIDAKNDQLADLVSQLQEINKNLEVKVQERTEEITAQKEIIEEKNRSIINSINYAERIQNALMPSPSILNGVLEDSFIFFQPRDIVSGDFYWFNKYENKLLITAADCTGHGVPGAIMSMIEINAIKALCDKQNITSPDLILNLLHKHIRDLFDQEKEGSVQDGMDISFCTYDLETKELLYSGARNPLIFIQEDESGTPILEVIKGDRKSIGGYQKEDEHFFTLHKMNITKPTYCYMLTDGYVDQFGEENGMKYTIKQLKEDILRNYNKPFSEQLVLLKETIQSWKGDTFQVDDILLIGFKLN